MVVSIPPIVKTGIAIKEDTLVNIINQKIAAINEEIKPENLPLYSPDSGDRNWFNDRFDSKIIWYLPSFQLLDDPDTSFSFEARLDKAPTVTGKPFHTSKLTLGLRKIIPNNIVEDKKNHPLFDYREIPLNNFTISLTLMAKDSTTGEDQFVIIPCSSITVNGDSILVLTFEKILGANVIILYLNLKNDIGANISISFNFNVWKQTVRPMRPFHVFTALTSSTNDTHLSALTSIIKTNNNLSSASTNPSHRVDLSAFTIGNVAINPDTKKWTVEVLRAANQGFEPGSFERISLPFVSNLPILRKFGADVYGLKFKLNIAGVIKHINRVSDLQGFDVPETEFTELKVLGNIGQKYPSISRLYLGSLSRTIIVIPSRYVILRLREKCAVNLNVLLDSSAASNFSPEYYFDFTLVPDVSAIDLMQLEQEINQHDETKGCILIFPKLMKSDSSKLIAPFVTKIEYLPGSSAPDSFLLFLEIKQSVTGIPAVANATLLIDRISATQDSLSGIIDIKLEDAFSGPVEIPVLVNLRHTQAYSNFAFRVEKSSKECIVTNISEFPLKIKRIAFITLDKVALRQIGQILFPGQTISLLLAQDLLDLNDLLLDSELPTNINPKQDLNRYIEFKTVDVMPIQFVIIINAAQINFNVHQIEKITIQIFMIDKIPGMENIPLITLDNDLSIAQIPCTLALNHALGVLNASLLCTIKFKNKPTRTFKRQHDFNQNRQFFLDPSDIPSDQ